MDNLTIDASSLYLIAALSMPQLEERLAFARATRQREAIARHIAANRKLWPRFRAALKAAVDMQTEAIKQREAAVAEIGEHAVTLHLPVIAFRGFLYSDLFDIYAAELDRVFAEPATVPAPVAVVAPCVQPAPARAVGAADRRVAEKPVAPVPPAEPVAPKPKRQPRRDKVSVGGRLVVMLRSGIEIEGEQTVAGDQVSVTMAQADSLLKAGAAELVNV